MARRAPPRCTPGALAAVLCAGCLPPERPYWVIDHTDALTLSFEVAARGPWGSDPPAAGGRVAEVMPGDRVRATAFVAGAEGPVDAGSLAPRWFACAEGLCSNQPFDWREVPACGPLELPARETCLLGQGAPLEFEIGALRDPLLVLTRGIPVLMVAGTPEGPDTRACLDRFAGLDARSASLKDCLFVVGQVRVGPAWRVPVLAAALGIPLALRPEQIPWEASQVEPDVLPEIERVIAWVPAPGGGEYYREVTPGGTLAVGAGDTIELSVVSRTPEQAFALLSLDDETGEVGASQVFEVQAAAWFSTVDAPFDIGGGYEESVHWTAPDEPAAVIVYVLLADGRSADAAWFRVEVEA